ncbi:MAG: peptidoglycan-binding protein [Tatlockia sp.]|nr:peptidoglycan-binding protein [Tatlockia sp.]
MMELETILDKNQVIDLETLTNDKELVKEIQTRLTTLGLLQPSGINNGIDGIFGPVTKAALERFCEIVDLSNMSTGLFGPTFAKKLIELRGPLVTAVTPDSSDAASDALATALKLTKKLEGGFVDNIHDLGGATNIGITQRTYNSFRIKKRLATKSVKFITDTEVHEIYSNMYWKPCKAELMKLPLAVVQFDTAVLFGVGGAIKFLQEALGVTADGIFGTGTATALQAHNNKQTANKMIDKRIAFHKKRVAEKPSQNVFLDGWLSRANQLRDFIEKLN